MQFYNALFNHALFSELIILWESIKMDKRFGVDACVKIASNVVFEITLT